MFYLSGSYWLQQKRWPGRNANYMMVGYYRTPESLRELKKKEVVLVHILQNGQFPFSTEKRCPKVPRLHICFLGGKSVGRGLGFNYGLWCV